MRISCAINKFSILREARIRPVACTHAYSFIDNPGFYMCKCIIMIVSIAKSYTSIFEFFRDFIINPGSIIDISFEYYSYIDSARFCSEYSFLRRFFCPGIGFEPDAFMSRIDI